MSNHHPQSLPPLPKGAEPLYPFLPKGGRTAQGRGLRNRLAQPGRANRGSQQKSLTGFSLYDIIETEKAEPQTVMPEENFWL